MMFISLSHEFSMIKDAFSTAWDKIRYRDFSYIDVASSVVSVGLAMLVAQLFHTEFETWAAFSAYVVMRPVFKQTWPRGLLRIVGTCLGGASGVAFMYWLGGRESLYWICVTLLIVNTASAYYSNVTSERYNYAILFFGLTFTLIIDYALAYPHQNIFDVGLMRTIDVVIGSLSTILVSLLVAYFFKRPTPDKEGKTLVTPLTASEKSTEHLSSQSIAVPKLTPSVAQPDIRWPFAWLVGVMIMLMPLTLLLHDNTLFIQAAVSILVVSNQPRTVQGIDLPVSTVRKLIYRATGCLCGGIMGMAFNLISILFSSYALLIVLTLIGTGIGRILQDSSKASSYIGTQFAVGLLMVCVHNTEQFANGQYGLSRFLGVMMGMGILVPGLFALSYWLYTKERKQSDQL